MSVMVATVILVTFLLITKDASARLIDTFIGQAWEQEEIYGLEGTGNEHKIFILYHGDRLVIERNQYGRTWIIGTYRSGTDYEPECIIPLQRTKISPSRVTLNVNINEKQIDLCK